jgi:hypothetical protein
MEKLENLTFTEFLSYIGKNNLYIEKVIRDSKNIFIIKVKNLKETK